MLLFSANTVLFLMPNTSPLFISSFVNFFSCFFLGTCHWYIDVIDVVCHYCYNLWNSPPRRADTRRRMGGLWQTIYITIMEDGSVSDDSGDDPDCPVERKVLHALQEMTLAERLCTAINKDSR